MARKKPKPRVSVSLPQALKSELETVARAQGQTVSNYLMTLILIGIRNTKKAAAGNELG